MQFNMQISSKMQSQVILTILLKKVLHDTCSSQSISIISVDFAWLVQNIHGLTFAIFAHMLRLF